MDRFGFNSTDQINLFMNYLDYMVDTYLLQATSEENIAMGTLFFKELNATYLFIEETLPITVASRVMSDKLE